MTERWRLVEAVCCNACGKRRRCLEHVSGGLDICIACVCGLAAAAIPHVEREIEKADRALEAVGARNAQALVAEAMEEAEEGDGPMCGECGRVTRASAGVFICRNGHTMRMDG